MPSKIVSTLLEIQRGVAIVNPAVARRLSVVSTLLEIQLERVYIYVEGPYIRAVSTLLEIQRLMCSVVVGF